MVISIQLNTIQPLKPKKFEAHIQIYKKITLKRKTRTQNTLFTDYMSGY